MSDLKNPRWNELLKRAKPMLEETEAKANELSHDLKAVEDALKLLRVQVLTTCAGKDFESAGWMPHNNRWRLCVISAGTSRPMIELPLALRLKAAKYVPTILRKIASEL